MTPPTQSEIDEAVKQITEEFIDDRGFVPDRFQTLILAATNQPKVDPRIAEFFNETKSEEELVDLVFSKLSWGNRNTIRSIISELRSAGCLYVAEQTGGEVGK